MLAKLYRTLTDFVIDEVKTARYLFFIVGIGFGLFTFFGDNEPIKGVIKHEWINAFDTFVAFGLFLALVLFPKTEKYYKQLGYALIYVLNLGNVYLLWGTSFTEQYAYQFIVVYAIAGWFFRTDVAYMAHAITVNVALVVCSLLAEHQDKATFDFYATYIIAAITQLVLIRNRFNIEQQSIESEKRYRLLAENSFDVICTHHADGSMGFVSPSVKRLLGYTPDELIGRKPYEIVHPEDKHIIRSLNLSEPNHPSIQNPVQYRMQHKDGGYIWIETIFVPLEKTKGVQDVVLSQTRDIRRSKSYQAQLEERTRELERSNSDLETFAYVSSHDMQEPLRMISNYMQLLKKRYSDKLEPEAVEYIEYANKGAVTLSQLIKDLLSYSRISRTEIKREPVNMNELFNEVKHTLQIQIADKNATVTTDPLCTVMADRNLLFLVLQNLILNGLKYNLNEAPEVHVSCSPQNGFQLFCVRDNGMGINPTHQQYIFEPFKRLHTKNEIPGTGLGLSICKKIIDRSGGRIWVESAEGQGARFYFTLPA